MINGLKIGVLVFVGAIVQLSMFESRDMIFGGSLDLLLVVLICTALAQGAVVGAVAGFAAGLIVDIATLGTLGVTALLLTLAGYWAGRYGETTGRGRAHAVPLAVAVITVLFAFGGLGLYYMLGEDVSAHQALITTLLPAIPLNVVAAWPVSRFCRRYLRPPVRPERAAELELGV